MKMKKIFNAIFLFSLLGCLGLSWPLNWVFTHPNREPFGSKAWIDKEVNIIKSNTSNIDTNVLRLSLTAYLRARQHGLDEKELLTVIDYSKPSYEKRLWVFDLKHGRTLFNTWVSHGKNSGGAVAHSFSNQPGSLKSSIGVFLTDTIPYMGGNGYSLRMRGLESGINSNAYNRDIVFHGAWYVNPDTIRRYGAVGRSWGCPAVSDKVAKTIINTIKERTLVFAYYPDRNWLKHSKYLA